MQNLNEPAFLLLETFLPERLRRLADLLSSAADQVCKKSNLTLDEWSFLAALTEEHEMSSSELCTRLTMHKTKVSRVLDRLVDRGFIERRTSPRDQRVGFLQITNNGRATYVECGRRLLQISRSFDSEFDVSEKQLVERILLKLLDVAIALRNPASRVKRRKSSQL